MKVGLAVLMLLILAFEVSGQDNMYSITWDIGMPVRDTHEFVHDLSWRGAGLEYRKFVMPEVSAGFSWHWNTFFETTGRTFRIENGHVSGTQDRRIQSSPLLTSLYYHFETMDDPNIRAYAGLGLDAYWISKRLDVGLLVFEEENWHFGMAPEVGVTVPVSWDSHLLAAVRYNYAFKGGASAAHAYWSFMLGLSYID